MRNRLFVGHGSIPIASANAARNCRFRIFPIPPLGSSGTTRTAAKRWIAPGAHWPNRATLLHSLSLRAGA